jgi:hypothetical protein
LNKQELTERIKQQNDGSRMLIELSDGSRHEIESVSQDGNAIIIHLEDKK